MNEELIKQLEQFRIKENLTHRELAEKLQFSEGTISRWRKTKHIKGIYALLVKHFLDNKGRTESYEKLGENLIPLLEKYRNNHNLTYGMLAQEMNISKEDIFLWKKREVLKDAPARIVGNFLKEKKQIK